MKDILFLKKFYNILFIIYISLLYLVNSEYTPIDKKFEEPIKDFIKKNREGLLLSNKKFKKVENPKVSIVIPIYNEENKILSTIRSIQNQNLQEIEIVCVNDNSNDNTLSKLKELRKEDPRITIKTNKINRGILFDRINGALEGKGEYIAFINPDDQFSNSDILKNAYEAATKKFNENIELVRFQVCGSGINNNEVKENLLLISKIEKDNFNKILKQPEILDNYFKNIKEIKDSDLFYDKLYSKKLMRRISNYIGPHIWNQNLTLINDILFSYATMENAKSFVNIDEIGYWHLINTPSNTPNMEWEIDGDRLKYPELSNKVIGDFIIVTERLFELTEKEKNSLEYREIALRLLGEKKYMKAVARSIHYDKYLRLCEKLVNWEFIDKEAKERTLKFAKDLLSFKVGSDRIFGYILDEEDEDDGLYDL